MGIKSVPNQNAIQKTLDATLSAGATSLTLNEDVSGLFSGVSATNPGVAVIDRIDSSGNATPSKREYVTFTGVSTTNLTGLTRNADGSGSDQEHSVGAIVELVPDVLWAQSIKDTFETEHEADGTHSADAIDAITEIASALKSGSDATLITGTAGTTDYTAKWNVDGDLVDGYQVLDEDTMSSDSAAALATQQSIKAYVDNSDHVTQYYFEAYANANQSVNNTTNTTLQINTEISDVGADFNTSTYLYTAPVNGIYTFAFSGSLTGLGAGKVAQVFLDKNSGTAIAFQEYVNGSASVTNPIISGAYIGRLAAGDTVGLGIWHNHGSSLNTSSGVARIFLHGGLVGTY